MTTNVTTKAGRALATLTTKAAKALTTAEGMDDKAIIAAAVTTAQAMAAGAKAEAIIAAGFAGSPAKVTRYGAAGRLIGSLWAPALFRLDAAEGGAVKVAARGQAVDLGMGTWARRVVNIIGAKALDAVLAADTEAAAVAAWRDRWATVTTKDDKATGDKGTDKATDKATGDKAPASDADRIASILNVFGSLDLTALSAGDLDRLARGIAVPVANETKRRRETAKANGATPAKATA